MNSTESLCLSLPLGPLPPGPRIALDIGGSLVKVAFIPASKEKNLGKSVQVEFRIYDVSRIDDVITFLDEKVIGARNHHKIQIAGTGVGSYKYKDRIQRNLDVEFMSDSQELVHAAAGLDLLWKTLPLDALIHNSCELVHPLKSFCPLKDSGLGTFVLASVGSALVMAEVNGEDSKVQYVGGCITAGHTFCGLGRLVTGKTTFPELLEMAESGDRSRVDLYVKDTAGQTYNSAPAETDVSSFGRLTLTQDLPEHSPADVAASLLYNVCDQIGTTTFLVCHGRHLQHQVRSAAGMRHVLFCGSFLSHNPAARAHLGRKLHACSQYMQYQLQPVFLRNEQYLGVLGVLQHMLKQTQVS